MVCKTRDRLFTEYRQTVKEWVESINKLEDEKNVYNERMLDRVDEMRFRANLAKTLYENHLTHHNC